MDSQSPQNFQNHDPYSLFQVPPQQEEELIDLKMSMKALIQIQNTFSQDINRLEAQISQVANTYRNKKTLPYQPLTNPDIFNPIDLAQESRCFGNQDSISSQHLELDQLKIIDKLASFHFNKIELDCKCDPDLQLCD